MLGTLRLSQPTLFGEVLFSISRVKLFLGFIPASVTHIVPVGWVKPPAAYPAKNQDGLESSKGCDRLPTPK